MDVGCYRCRTLRYPLYILSAIAIANVVFLIILIGAMNGLVAVEQVYSYDGDDFPTQLPYKLPTVGLVLDTKEEHFGLHANADWATQEYSSDGFTDLGPSNRTFVVSMVHQMHCLETFRVGFTANPPGYAHHVEHCLRYMRHMVLCHADTTLESAEPVFVEGSWRYGASGVGSVYKCKDWTALREYLEENPAHRITGRG